MGVAAQKVNQNLPNLGAEALPNGDVLIRTINHSPVLLNQLAYLRILNKAWAETRVWQIPANKKLSTL